MYKASDIALVAAQNFASFFFGKIGLKMEDDLSG
jgi:hypothetical protein